mmetsp:Transcript_12547/g.28893  ORF Transcript_12547/g.28893 Transcript_12547/m.28893 type:complete len:99 (-) Transcript_12547:332-628(-)
MRSYLNILLRPKCDSRLFIGTRTVSLLKPPFIVCSSGWPYELPSPYNVEVQMIYALEAVFPVVDHDTISVIQMFFASELGGNKQQMAQQRCVLLLGLS